MTTGAWDSTGVTPIGDGRYRATISGLWVLAMVPQGGVIAAIAARAIAAELGTDQPLRAIHGVFARPVPAGEVEAVVEVIRRGRSVSQAQVTVSAVGQPTGFSAVAVFGGDREGFSFTELSYPDDVPAPEDCPGFRDPPPPEAPPEWHREDGPWPFWGQVLEGKAAIGHPPWDESPREAARVVNWFRFDEPPVLGDGCMDPLGLLVMADVMPGAVFERIGGRDAGWFAPSIDLSLSVFARPTPGWILADTHAHHAGDGFASAECALWDPRAEGGPALVAWASQQMFFTKMT